MDCERLKVLLLVSSFFGAKNLESRNQELK